MANDKTEREIMDNFKKLKSANQELAKVQFSSELDRMWTQHMQDHSNSRLKRDGKLEAKKRTINDSGHEDTYLNMMGQMAKKFANPSLNGFTQWITAMLELVNLFELFVRAYGPSVAAYRHQATDFIYDQTIERIRKAVHYKGSSDPDVKGSELAYNVHFDNNNKLVIDPLKSMSTGKPFDHDLPNLRPAAAALNEAFADGIKLWLKKNGYEEDPRNPGTYKNGAQQLTKESFEALKSDPENGLAKFLSGDADLRFSQAPGPS
ncbi:hypothetical protein [Legionella waltersii]|uniref:Membrane-associated HD superfamily hydrolase n=1 Tax=Legionella waltersii TaxID=66969 RepID=A0A0W1A0Z0_9GAMM|nr:hypothetical protein [Legionella waltersii]KTD75045.1 membrane-associated HD superfamily hydrolase [Legionella waltersii]SNV05390.1 membrane-associated HD superfamily hydrolase [Legionella waltersii]